MPRVARLPILALIFLALLTGVALAVTQVTSKGLRLNGMPISVTSSLASGATATATGVDSDKNQSKHAWVHKWTVNGQEVDVLIRVEAVPGRGIFVDMVADATITSLSTTVSALSITTCPGHPSTTKDHVDKEALVAAGGS